MISAREVSCVVLRAAERSFLQGISKLFVLISHSVFEKLQNLRISLLYFDGICMAQLFSFLGDCFPRKSGDKLVDETADFVGDTRCISG